MCCNAAIDGDERTMVKRLLTEIYPHASFSMVSDSYDYWNMVDNILPTLKEEILNHDGKLLVRPDSGDIIDISVKTIEHLWDIFGGTVNTKGFKVLDPHIGCVYGDGVTISRAATIYKKLYERGFAANNIVFGAGSFSFTCYQDRNGEFQAFTRDTWSCAIKATGGIVNGEFIPIFKDPKTDRESGFSFKKSQKGCCEVQKDSNTGLFKFVDGIDPTVYENMEFHGTNSAYRLVFKDGETVNEESLTDIRKRLHGNF
jgi:nicotinamide phosphoribosyltransferase